MLHSLAQLTQHLIMFLHEPQIHIHMFIYTYIYVMVFVVCDHCANRNVIVYAKPFINT